MTLYLTFTFSFFIVLAIHAQRVLLTVYALKLGAQPLTVGVLAALFSVLPTLLAWQVGRLSDRFGSRWLITIGAGSGVAGMLIPWLFPGLAALYAAALMNGLLLGLSGSPMQNLMGLLSKNEQESARNFSNYSLIVSFTGFLGPLLAGSAFDGLGPGPACLVMTLLPLISFLLLLLKGGYCRAARAS